jgi:hypothetical protein
MATVSGARTLINYAIIGTVEQYFTALPHGQLPLGSGFTIETPWTVPELHYQVGTRGLPTTMQWEAHLAGQRVFQDFPLRTHTTGLIDYGVRNGLLGSESALELIHPGRVARIHSERNQQDETGGILTMNLLDGPIGLSAGNEPPYGYNADGWANKPERVDTDSTGITSDWGEEQSSSAMGFATAPGGSSGGIVNDYTRHRFERI